jgi:ABC-type uncharacterized transport system YnjBCD ATPase subunit
VGIKRVITSIRNRLEQEKGKLAQLAQEQTRVGEQITHYESIRDDVAMAQAVIQQVAQATQEQLALEVSGLVTMALQAIFPNPHQFKCEFVQRRGKTEADLLFERNGAAHNPMLSSGGGPVDVAAFALRVSLWSLAKTSQPVIVLDEPMKHLSADLRPRAAELVHTLAEELGLQVIMVTHAEEFIEAADKVFYVSQTNGISKVEEG